jgi:glycosyltransferase involved in cell wall biosynthesis
MENSSNALLFSIIIPTYNRGLFIKQTIESVLFQTYSNFEIIIVDDGSTDNTEEIVMSLFDNRITYYKKENGERAKARNFGAKKAKGDYINFLDSDDVLLPNHLDEAIKMISQYNFPEIFHLNYEIRDENRTLISTPINFKGNLNTALIKKGNLLSCNGVFLRNDIALLYPFNEDRNLSASEDYELWLRLAARFNIFYSNTLTSTILNHNQRSVLNFNTEPLIMRLNLFIYYVFNDDVFSKQFYKYKNLMIAHTYTYIALHISLTGEDKKTALRYLLKAFTKSYKVIFSKRFYVIPYKLITKQ